MLLTLQIVGGRWKGIVIWNLREEKKRFCELKRILVSINDKILSQVLKELEEQVVVKRKVCELVPQKVEYSLTKEGKKLLPIVQAMNDYGQIFWFNFWFNTLAYNLWQRGQTSASYTLGRI
ncbi:MAG: helix-turn-helix domain-containing protein [Bacteroidota bacterium]